MDKELRWFVIALAWIGAATILGAMGWGAFYLAFRNFSGANCTDTEQKTLVSPDGGHSIKSFHRECGASPAYFVYLSTGNPNKGYEYTPIVQIENVPAEKVSVHWNGPNEVNIAYPSSAKIVEAYAQILGVRVVLNPSL